MISRESPSAQTSSDSSCSPMEHENDNMQPNRRDSDIMMPCEIEKDMFPKNYTSCPRAKGLSSLVSKLSSKLKSPESYRGCDTTSLPHHLFPDSNARSKVKSRRDMKILEDELWDAPLASVPSPWMKKRDKEVDTPKPRNITNSRDFCPALDDLDSDDLFFQKYSRPRSSSKVDRDGPQLNSSKRGARKTGNGSLREVDLSAHPNRKSQSSVGKISLSKILAAQKVVFATSPEPEKQKSLQRLPSVFSTEHLPKDEVNPIIDEFSDPDSDWMSADDERNSRYANISPEIQQLNQTKMPHFWAHDVVFSSATSVGAGGVDMPSGSGPAMHQQSRNLDKFHSKTYMHCSPGSNKTNAQWSQAGTVSTNTRYEFSKAAPRYASLEDKENQSNLANHNSWKAAPEVLTNTHLSALAWWCRTGNTPYV